MKTFFEWFKLPKTARTKYYKTPFVICKNCQRTFAGYEMKGILITDIACPHCFCTTLKLQKEK